MISSLILVEPTELLNKKYISKIRRCIVKAIIIKEALKRIITSSVKKGPMLIIMITFWWGKRLWREDGNVDFELLIKTNFRTMPLYMHVHIFNLQSKHQYFNVSIWFRLSNNSLKPYFLLCSLSINLITRLLIKWENS